MASSLVKYEETSSALAIAARYLYIQMKRQEIESQKPAQTSVSQNSISLSSFHFRPRPQDVAPAHSARHFRAPLFSTQIFAQSSGRQEKTRTTRSCNKQHLHRLKMRFLMDVKEQQCLKSIAQAQHHPSSGKENKVGRASKAE